MAILPSNIRRKEISEQCQIYSGIITGNVRKDPLRSRYASIGYDDAAMEDGRALLENLQSLHTRHRNLKGEKEEARRVRDKKIGEAHALAGITRKILKIVLDKESGFHEELGIHEPRVKKSKVHDWIQQHDRFYRNMSAPVRGALKRFGYDKAKLKSESALVQEIVALHKRHEDLTAEASKVKVQRDAALKVMQEWISDFIKLGQIACMDRPQLLEAMGILVRNK